MTEQPCTECIQDETPIDLATIQLHDDAGTPISRRDFGKNMARFGFVLSAAVFLGIKTVNEAVAATCTCGTTSYGGWYCEQVACSGGYHNSGRSRRMIYRKNTQGPPPTYCGAPCSYWTAWACNGVCVKGCNGWC